MRIQQQRSLEGVGQSGHCAGSRRAGRRRGRAWSDGGQVRETRRVLQRALGWLMHGGATQWNGQWHGLAEAVSWVPKLDAAVGA